MRILNINVIVRLLVGDVPHQTPIAEQVFLNAVGSGGIYFRNSELRGNGQLLLRQAIDAAGGFNEDTVTDDLDLSFRLLLAGQPVGSLWDPPVREEAVLGLRALLRQLQRFFDYWPGLISSRLTAAQRCRRRSEGPPLPAMTPLNLMLGIFYLGHWFVVIPWTSMRMALRPK